MSSHPGLIVSINATFFCLRQALSCFSRAMASRMLNFERRFDAAHSGKSLGR